ncbi:MAG: beta-ketoacyl synthase N-terminal-like domain-containing protein, partial [Tsuneonella sp.]
MRDAVIVSTARTPLAKAGRGAFNATHAVELGAFSVKAAAERAGLDGSEIDDCIMGAASQGGMQGMNVGRNIALMAGFPNSVPGMSIDRQCSSGLMSIATAAKQIIVDRMDVCVAGGLESISGMRAGGGGVVQSEALLALHPDIYMPMIGTA